MDALPTNNLSPQLNPEDIARIQQRLNAIEQAIALNLELVEMGKQPQWTTFRAYLENELEGNLFPSTTGFVKVAAGNKDEQCQRSELLAYCNGLRVALKTPENAEKTVRQLIAQKQELKRLLNQE